MAFLQSQVSFPMWSNLPRDVITNTMHWESDGITNTAAAIEIANRLSDFYDLVYSDPGSAATYVLWSQGEVKVYDLAETPPRVPIVQSVPVAPVGPTNTMIPTEVAVVLSFHAAPESGTPSARLRNRIYLGGLGNDAMSSGSTTAFPFVNNGFRTTIDAAATALLAANTSSLAWVQRSSVGLITARPIVGGWIDDTPDTQRRRGVNSLNRTLWP